MQSLLPILSGLAAALVVILLARRVRPTPAQAGERWLVGYGPVYKVLSAAFFPLSAFVTYAASQASPDQTTLAAVIAAGFWFMTLYLAYEMFLVHLSYDDAAVYHQSPLRGQRRIPWEAIIEVRYSPLTQVYTLRTEGYGSVSVSPLADGHQALLEQAHARQQARSDTAE